MVKKGITTGMAISLVGATLISIGAYTTVLYDRLTGAGLISIGSFLIVLGEKIG